MNYLMYFIIILIIIILLQQHISNIKPFQNNNNTINRNNRKKSNKNNQVKEGFTDFPGLTKKTISKIYSSARTNAKQQHDDEIKIGLQGDKLEYIRIVANWKDQGWGNRKSRLYLSFEDENGNEYDIPVCNTNRDFLALHNFTKINFKLYADMSYTYDDFQNRTPNVRVESKRKLENSPGIDFDINKKYTLRLRYIVGGGGGHSITVNNIEIYVKTYPKNLTYSYIQGYQLNNKEKIYKQNPNLDPELNICDIKSKDPSDNNLFKLQYYNPITISFWADFNSLIKSGITNKTLISYINRSGTSGWDLSIKGGSFLQLNLKSDGKDCFKIPIKFKLNKDNMEKENNKTGNFVHYLISTQGYQRITDTRYMCISFMKENDGSQQTLPSSIINGYEPKYVNYDNTFGQNPKILENSYIDHIKIVNYFFDYTNTHHRMDFLNDMKCFPYMKSKEKIIIDYTTDYDKAKPYIDEIQKFGEIGGPLHSSLTNLQDSFHKDFNYYEDKGNFDNNLISTMKNHINIKKTLLQGEKETGDTQTKTISELEKSADILNTEIMISVNEDLNPYQDKTLKSNSYGSIINHLDNIGQGSYIIRNNDKRGKCLYTSSYKEIPNNDTQYCNANDISQKVNVYHINQDSDYVQHLPKINNTTELHKIPNHTEFKYPFKIVKSKNNNQCLHNYDINKYKFGECIPNVAQQYRMWDKESK
jgi:hypothetical protein